MLNDNTHQKFDLEDRTSAFGRNVVQFCTQVSETTVTRPLLNQLVRSATSVGANYMEANGASSKKDFLNKIYIVKKECKETEHWLRMMATAVPLKKDELRKLWQECHELTLIFSKIAKTTKGKATLVVTS